MTNQPKSDRAPEPGEDSAATTEPGVTPESTASDVGAAEPSSDDAMPSEEDVLAKLAAENEELKDRALRVAAEMENLRRRTARDVQEARAYAISNFARDMLSVSDNLRRALEAVPADARDTDQAGIKALIDGVEMTERSMHTTLENHGVKKIEPQGEKFDPHFHQAMFEVADETVPANTVVQIVQTGYVIGERVLRPAMVGVAKGGPKASASPAPKAADAANDGAKAEPGAPDPWSEKDA